MYKIFSRRNFAAINIYRVTHCPEGIKTDTERKDYAKYWQVRFESHCAQEGRHGIYKEIKILEKTENTEVKCDADKK